MGALAYADDIVLMAPTATAMRKLLAVCDEFAGKFDVMFNASSSLSACFFVHASPISIPSWERQICLSAAVTLNLSRSGPILVIT